MKTKATLTKQDWLKLEGWTAALAAKVEQKIKPGYYDRDDVESELRLSYAKLITTWKPGPQDVTTYIWQWAAPLTVLRINRAIEKITYDLLQELEPEEDPDRPMTEKPDPDEQRINRERAREVYDKMSDEDKQIADAIMEGKSYAEIGEEHGMTAQAVLARMRKYGDDQ